LKKEEIFPELFCEDCLKDPEVECKRDLDVQCIHCGKKLCGYHMARHLEKEHLVDLNWKGLTGAST